MYVSKVTCRVSSVRRCGKFASGVGCVFESSTTAIGFFVSACSMKRFAPSLFPPVALLHKPCFVHPHFELPHFPVAGQVVRSSANSHSCNIFFTLVSDFTHVRIFVQWQFLARFVIPASASRTNSCKQSFTTLQHTHCLRNSPYSTEQPIFVA